MESKNRAAREVAPEDIRRGDVVAVPRELDERVPVVSEDQSRRDTQIGTVRAWILPRARGWSACWPSRCRL